MSHFSSQLDIFIEAKIPFMLFGNIKTGEKVIVTGTRFASIEEPGDDYELISSFTGERHRTEGYSEFYTEFWFDSHGRLREIGIWE